MSRSKLLMGGVKTPNAVESVLLGALVPALIDGKVHGVWFSAQDYVGKRVTDC